MNWHKAISRSLQTSCRPVDDICKYKKVNMKPKHDFTSFGIKNWKVFSGSHYFDFSRINLLIGTNNSGKTSLVEAINLAENIFNNFEHVTNKAGYTIGKKSDFLFKLIDIDLPDQFQHYEEFKELINYQSKSGEISFILTVANVFFPDKTLWVHLVYIPHPENKLAARLKEIQLYTTKDELIGKTVLVYLETVAGPLPTFKTIYNYKSLHPYLKRASVIQKLVDDYEKIMKDYLYNYGSNKEESYQMNVKTNDEEKESHLKKDYPILYNQRIRIKDQLFSEYNITDSELSRIFNKTEMRNPKNGLYFDYIFFTRDIDSFEEELPREKMNEFLQRVNKKIPGWLENFKLLFNKLAEPVEEIILSHLWDNNISIETFSSDHRYSRFAFSENYSEYNDSWDGIEIVRISEESELYTIIRKEIVEIRKLVSSDELSYYMSSIVMLNPFYEERKYSFWNRIMENALMDIKYGFDMYFSNYKSKRLQSFYRLRHNELGLDERIFNVLGKSSIPDEIIQFINKYIREFSIGEELIISRLEPINAVSFSIKKGKRKESIVHLGYGSTNILIVLLSVLSIASRNRFERTKKDLQAFEELSGKKSTKQPGFDYKSAILFLEEPEANLHPALQSKLADLIVEANKLFNIQFVIETHSEYFLRKLQYLVAKKELPAGDIKMYYFNDPGTIDAEKEEQVYAIDINEDGSLTESFGPGFYDEAANWKFELLTLINEQRN